MKLCIICGKIEKEEDYNEFICPKCFKRNPEFSSEKEHEDR